VEPVTGRSRRTAHRRARVAGALLTVVLLGLVAGCTSATKAPTVSSNAGTGSPTPVPEIAPELQAFYMQQLHWKSCGDSFQCSTLTVPMDYSNPAQRSLRIAMIRLPATDQKHRLGSLVINPGGPGGSGIDYARQAKTVISSAVRKRYDIVGFDPRGVGRSDPVHCLTAKQTDQFIAADPTPTTPAQVAEAVSLAKGFAADCQARVGTLLDFVGTRDAAHDLDVMRSALGDAKLNYLGKSYGTYLGATYADEFPTHVGRMVLDGVLDPSLTSEQINLGQAKGFELATRSFLADCVKRSSCPLGRNLDQAVTRLGDLLRGLDAHPLRTKDSGRPLTEGWGTLGVALPLYNKSYWSLLRSALAQALQGNGQGLLTLADAYAARNSNGTYQDNSNDALYAVNCQDHPQRGGLAQIESDATSFAKQAPTWGSMLAWGSLVCVYWPNKPTEAPKAISATGSGPILVVGTTRDPATPYEWAVSLSKELANGHLLTYNGDGHTAYRQGSGCVDTVVDSYLLKDSVPADGKRC
jgi:pimeloyl-ACP methyl ester carboxylesterase